MKTLYAMITRCCNLKCPHCNIGRNGLEEFNLERFLKELNNFEGNIILFGGEPTVFEDRLFQVVELHDIYGKSKINSISTNLILLDEKLINYYKKIQYVATSWNKTRFHKDEYHTWLRNLKILGDNYVKPGILITLTNDLIDADVEEFLKIIDEWPHECISWIRFEHLIDDSNTPDYYDIADEWLCHLYKKWRSPIKVQTFDKSLNWYYDCTNVYTLTPDGILHHACPNGLNLKKNILDRCFICDKCNECRPCILHQYCSYPHKLHELMEVQDNG